MSVWALNLPMLLSATVYIGELQEKRRQQEMNVEKWNDSKCPFSLLFTQFKCYYINRDSGLAATCVQRPTLLYFGDANCFQPVMLSVSWLLHRQIAASHNTWLSSRVTKHITNSWGRPILTFYWSLFGPFCPNATFFKTTDSGVCTGFRSHHIFVIYAYYLLLLWWRTQCILQMH